MNYEYIYINQLLNEIAREYKIYEEYNSNGYDKWYKLCEYIQTLEQALDEIEKHIKDEQDEQSEQAGFYNSFSEYITIDVDKLLQIIKRVKGE